MKFILQRDGRFQVEQAWIRLRKISRISKELEDTFTMILRLTLALLLMPAHGALAQSPQRPLFRDFVGLCGHNVQFKPELYRPVCRVVRDYHPVRWDLDKDTSVMPEWPFAKNRVSWEKVYRSWDDEGLRISVCLIFDDMKGEDWKDIANSWGQNSWGHKIPGDKIPGDRLII